MARGFRWGVATIPLIGLLAFVGHYGGSGYPYSDGFTISVPVAISVADGSFRLIDLFGWHNGHLIVFSRLLTVISTVLHGWSPVFEVWANVVLGVLNALILLGIARQTTPQYTSWFALPIAVLMLSTDFGMTWLVGIFSQWHFVMLFSLFSVYAITAIQREPLALTVGVLAAACASLSAANGLLAWGMLVMAMMFSGRYRRWWLYAPVIVGGAVFAWVYGTTILGGDGGSSVSPPSLWELFQFNLIYWGRPFVHREHLIFARWLGGLGAVTFIVNVWAYWRAGGDVRPLGAWLAVMTYGVGGGVLYALSRFETFGGYFAASVERYLHTSSVIWVGLYGVVILTIGAVWQRRAAWRGLLIFNALAVGFITMSYAANIRFGVFRMDYDFRVWQIQEAGACMARYPLERDALCAGETHIIMTKIDPLAAWKLGGFSDQQPQNILPYYYETDPVIVAQADLWGALHVRDWWLDGVRQVVTVAPPDLAAYEEQIAALPHPPAPRYETANTPALQQRLDDAPAFWWLTHPERPVSGEDALLADYHRVGEFDLPYGYRLTRYLTEPPPVAQSLTFDGWLTLDGWRVVGGETANACDTLTVQTWWSRSAPLPETETRFTLALVPDDWSRGIDNTDAPPGIIPLAAWERGATYGDERQITLPCDLSAGRYLLAVGAYQFDVSAGAFLGDLPITTLSSETPEYRHVIAEINLP